MFNSFLLKLCSKQWDYITISLLFSCHLPFFSVVADLPNLFFYTHLSKKSYKSPHQILIQNLILPPILSPFKPEDSRSPSTCHSFLPGTTPSWIVFLPQLAPSHLPNQNYCRFSIDNNHYRLPHNYLANV